MKLHNVVAAIKEDASDLWFLLKMLSRLLMGVVCAACLGTLFYYVWKLF
jgi:hypothetical protein